MSCRFGHSPVYSYKKYLVLCRLRRGGSHKLGGLTRRKHMACQKPFRVVHLNRRNGLPTSWRVLGSYVRFFIILHVPPNSCTIMYSLLFEVNTLSLSLSLTAVLAVVLCFKTTPAYAMALSSTISTLTSTQPNSEKRLGDIPTHVLKRLTSKSRACVERLRACQLDRLDL